MKKTLILISLLAAGFIFTSLVFADQGVTSEEAQGLASEQNPATESISNECPTERSLESIEVLSGFAWGDLDNNDKDYNLYPIYVGLDFNLKPLTRKFHFEPSSLLQFQVEPFIGSISSPKSNLELGTTFFFKVGILPQTSKVQPYIKAGVGMDYMTLHTTEQSTQFNFIPTGAAGCHFFISKNVAFTLEGRYRHLSNSGIDHPNGGINCIIADAGLLFQF